MITNRSVPTNILLPHLAYQNLEHAIDWLTTVFGFVELYRYGESGGEVSGAQMRLGEAVIMLHRARRPRYSTPAELGCGTQSLTAFVDNVDAHFQRAKAAGARIVEDLHETVYGERQYGVEDLDGHHWLFSQHARDVRPDQWGAIIANR